MSYIDEDQAQLTTRTAASYYELPRRKVLDKQFSKRVSVHFGMLRSGCRFESRGLLVTGSSRTGKTREINEVIQKFNLERVILPNGLPARFVQCSLSSTLNWKDLGIKALEALHYPMNAQRTQTYIWGKVLEQAKLQGVIGIHFDEAQHMFGPNKEASNTIVLDGFKALMKEASWPLVLILSGVPELARYVQSYEQLKFLMDPIHFGDIQLPQDRDEMNRLAFALGDQVAVDFQPLSYESFYDVLAFSCNMRWGLAIELIRSALDFCVLDGKAAIGIEHIEAGFAERTGIPKGYSPFSVDDYESAFDPDRLAELMQKTS